MIGTLEGRRDGWEALKSYDPGPLRKNRDSSFSSPPPPLILSLKAYPDT